MNVNIKVENQFITPIVVAKFNDVGVLNQNLKSLFLKLESEPDKYKNKSNFNTNIGSLFDSSFNLFESSSPYVKEIKSMIEDSLRGWIIQSSGLEANQVIKLNLKNHAWFHITRKGGQKTLHNHPNASWSVVYYIDEGDIDSENRSGFIQFYDPRAGANMHQDSSNMYLKREYNTNGVAYQPRSGLMLIFPSYLHHEVLPYLGDKPRINIAANYWVE